MTGVSVSLSNPCISDSLTTAYFFSYMPLSCVSAFCTAFLLKSEPIHVWLAYVNRVFYNNLFLTLYLTVTVKDRLYWLLQLPVSLCYAVWSSLFAELMGL
ncbi:hypothetical protein AMECASPLE_037856 [Ameca splendens]|uniref:Uncharacterized protein n=1 Tax=Ameca splendens TaxID=208324 RepID=A0ABV0Z5W8_9TELE